MRGGTNAAVMERGVVCPYIVAFSVYDTKPVHFLSMAAEKLVWNINKEEIYDKATKKRRVYSSIALSCKIFITKT